MTGLDLSLADPKIAVIATAGICMAFALKHYVADFVLQTNWMARGKEQMTGWFAPLVVHAGCHALIALILTLALSPKLWWLSLVDFGVHFLIDRGKTAMSHWGQWRIDQPAFWWLLGFDQLLHQLTNVALAAAIILL